MDHTAILQDAEGIEGNPIDLEDLRGRLHRRAELRRQEYSRQTDVAMFQELLTSLDRLRAENPTMAATAEYHYLSKASLRSIAIATGRSQTACERELRMVRAWVLRATKGVIE